jgi:hypothetical protein
MFVNRNDEFPCGSIGRERIAEKELGNGLNELKNIDV